MTDNNDSDDTPDDYEQQFVDGMKFGISYVSEWLQNEAAHRRAIGDPLGGDTLEAAAAALRADFNGAKLTESADPSYS